MHKVETILSLSGVKEYIDTLKEDMMELEATRNAQSVEAIASIFEELNKKARIVANRHNKGRKSKDQISTDFFLNVMGTNHSEVVEDFILVKKNVSTNKKLLSQYPTICVKAEGFKDLRAVLAILGYHKRERSLEKLLKGDKREKRKPRVETIDKSYMKDNTLLVYSIAGDPLLEKKKKKGRGKNWNRKGGKFNKKKGGN